MVFPPPWTQGATRELVTFAGVDSSPETVNRRTPKKATDGVGLICMVKS